MQDTGNVFTGIDHPAVAAADPEKLSRWYCGVLGYQVIFSTPKQVFILRAADGTCIEIMPKDATIRPERTCWTPGWSHLALRVSDFDAAAQILAAHGVELAAEGKAVGGGRLCNFYDPEGNMLQIIERAPGF